MRKNLILLFMIVLSSTIGVACNNIDSHKDPAGQNTEQQDIKEVRPVAVSQDIAAFFDKNSYSIGHAVKHTAEKGDYFMFNSWDELPKVDPKGNPIEYPDIDFDSYTLILSYFYAPDSGYYVAKQNAGVGLQEITINITAKKVESGIGLSVPSLISFWGIYPKLPDKPITVIQNQLINDQP